MSEKIRTAAYARVSQESARMEHSISAQTDYYYKIITGNLDWEYAGIYADRGISGTSIRNRKEFNRMLADCEADKIDRILVKSVSRFARNTLDLLKTVRHLKKLGISVWFEEQEIDSMSEEGEFLLTLAASVAQAESENISENAKWAIHRSFQKGIANTKRRTFGYQWVNGVLTVIPEEAETVRRIFSEFLSGSSQSAIARGLIKEDIRTVLGNRFSVSSVGFILRNITYTGNTLLQKTFISDPVSGKKIMNKGELPQYLVHNDHEAIVSMETFEKVQQKFEQNKRSKQFPYNHTGQKYAFTGKIICGLCGRHYTRQLWNTNKGGSKKATWICTGKKIEPYRRCNARNITEEKLIAQSMEVLGQTEFDRDRDGVCGFFHVPRWTEAFTKLETAGTLKKTKMVSKWFSTRCEL